MTSLKELLTERAESTTRDEIWFRDMDIRLKSLDAVELVVEDQRYSLSAHAVGQLCTNLAEIPAPFARRCPPTLLQHNLNELLRPQNGSIAILHNGSVVRSFMDARHAYVPSLDIYKVVSDGLNVDEPYYEAMDDGNVAFTMLSPKHEYVDVGGTKLRGGVKVLHSDSWSTGIKFETFLLREICENGATIPIRSRKFRVGSNAPSAIISQVSEFTELAESRIEQMIEGFEKLRDIKVHNLQTTIRKICLENKLPAKVAKLLLDYSADVGFLSTVEDGVVSSMYDVANLITYVATHVGEQLTDAHREHLYEIGGVLMLTNEARCGSCGSNL